MSANAYQAIVVPNIMDKLPQAVKLSITRGKEHFCVGDSTNSNHPCHAGSSDCGDPVHTSPGRVALQTAQAVLKGEKGVRVRVLFDTGSHSSFVTCKVARSVGLKVIRQEWIEISTFGGQSRESGLRKVCEIEVFPMQGGEGVPIEAYEVPSITQIRNEHLEVRKAEYPHLQWYGSQMYVKRKKALLIQEMSSPLTPCNVQQP